MTSYGFSGRSKRRVTSLHGLDSELDFFVFFWEVEVREEVCEKESGKITKRDRTRAKTVKICFMLFN